MVVGSKADAAAGGAGHPFDGLRISSVTGEGLPALLGRIAAAVDASRRGEQAGDGTVVVHRPAPEGIRVERVDGGFAVSGRSVERAVALNDVTTDEASAYVEERLRRLGVDRALARAGARDGDVVTIGPLTFTWYRDQPELTVTPRGRRRA